MSQTTTADAERLALAEAWIAQDPDPETREELAALVEGVRAGDAGASAELADRFDTRLDFGTAGLRGEIAAGPNRMNRVLVAQAAAGIAEFLLERARPGETPSVVIVDGVRLLSWSRSVTVQRKVFTALLSSVARQLACEMFTPASVKVSV